MPDITRPDDIPDDTPITKLAAAYAWHTGALADHATGMHTLTAHRRHQSIRAALALGAKLADRIGDERWPLVVDALACGDTADQVAVTTGLEPGELTDGVIAWAEQRFAPDQCAGVLIKARFVRTPDGTWSI